MKQLLFIVNPRAGMRKVVRQLPDIIALFTSYGYENLVYITTCQGDATRIAASRGKDVDLVVCAGGDGTFNEVVAGLLQVDAQTHVGYIPCGSTNDFANTLHLPKSIMEAAESIMTGEPCGIDIGRFGARYFSYVASFGAFTKTSYSTPQSVKNALGHLAYLLEGIKDIPSIRPIHVRIETDTEVLEDDYLFGAVSNSTSVGGVLTLNPQLVDLNDGMFEVLLIKSPKDIVELNECIRCLSAQDYQSGAIVFGRTRSAQILCPEPLNWTLDGELAADVQQVHVENLHSAIQLIVPGAY